MTILTTIQIVNGELIPKSDINEDQIIACNFESKCVTLDIDDFMNQDKRDHLWSIYNNDIDTYSVEDLN